MTTNGKTYQANALVLHARHGQGTVLLTDGDTTGVNSFVKTCSMP